MTRTHASRQTREFRPHALRPEWLVARFGRTVVTIKPAPDRTIYRGEETDAQGVRIPAGVWPGFGYSVEVQGEMTCRAATLDAAKAIGEWRALNSETNFRRVSSRLPLAYSLTPERAAECLALIEADTAALIEAYPFDPEYLPKMIRGSEDYPRIHAHALEKEAARLCGAASPFA